MKYTTMSENIIHLTRFPWNENIRPLRFDRKSIWLLKYLMDIFVKDFAAKASIVASNDPFQPLAKQEEFGLVFFDETIDTLTYDHISEMVNDDTSFYYFKDFFPSRP
ncbi:hypothetical protein SNEBB_007186 [Seison nebaliae]|nr:hypothetical protein SNEBB_007186 [Seison nebaliae]